MKNLLYYQTNYFAMTGIIFVLFGLFHPGKMCLGITILFGVLYATTKFVKRPSAPGQPNIYVIFGSIGFFAYIILYLLDSVLIVAFALLLPFALTFLHSSLRLRNLSNKLTNTLEIVGIKHSPMGKFLEGLGLMPDTFWFLRRNISCICHPVFSIPVF